MFDKSGKISQATEKVEQFSQLNPYAIWGMIIQAIVISVVVILVAYAVIKLVKLYRNGNGKHNKYPANHKNHPSNDAMFKKLQEDVEIVHKRVDKLHEKVDKVNDKVDKMNDKFVEQSNDIGFIRGKLDNK